MKIAIAIIISLIFSANVKAQSFELLTATTQGAIINRDFEGDLFIGTIQVTPSFTLEKLSVGLSSLSYTTQKETGFLAGVEVGYNVFDVYSVTARTMYGNTGKQLIGGGAQMLLDGKVVLFGNAGYELKDKEAWLDLGIGYKIIQ